MRTAPNIWRNYSKPKGFTIVELLIVIVVIAILASVTVVAYNGVQQRASNLQNTSLAKSFGEGLALYLTDKGTYPPGTNNWICLGNGTTDINSDGQYDCVYNGSSVELTRDAVFNNALRPYANVDGKAANISVTEDTGKKLSGVEMWPISGGVLDGKPHTWFMFYVIKGDATCDYGKVVNDVGWPSFSSTRPPEGYTYQYIDGRGCLVALPNPNSI